MNTLRFGLSVTLIGMLVVFVGLVVLILCIKGISLLAGIQRKPGSSARSGKSVPAVGQGAETSVALRGGQSASAQDVAPEVLAVITAAIAAVWQGPTGFTVRHVKRVSNAPAWNKAGREEQTYSRY